MLQIINTKFNSHSRRYRSLCQHLFQMYPDMPKYAADPEQSDIIRMYDYIMLRFAGHYGKQPTYFVKSPLCGLLYGDNHKYLNMSKVSFATNQEVIIAISPNTCNKIRLNHYETTLYGQIELPIQLQQYKVKHSQNEQQNLKTQYVNLITQILKTIMQNNMIKQLPYGLDILVYRDFIDDQFLYTKQAFIYGLYTAVHTAIFKNKMSLDEKILHKSYQKVATLSTSYFKDMTHCIDGFSSLIHSNYNKLFVEDISEKCEEIPFLEGKSIVMANSMTPLPKKLIKGKRFNLRECEVQIALELIISELGLIKQVRSLNELMQTITCNIDEINDSLESIVPNKSMTTEQIQTALEKPLIQVLKHIPFANNVIDQNAQFHPYKRLKYFIQQQKIIRQLKQHPEKLIQLVKQSQKNAEELLQIGSQQIQDLVLVTNPWVDAYKVVGAGWGGNLLLICQTQKVQKMVQDIVNNFYLSQKNKILLSDDIEMYIKIIGKPGKGLMVLNPENQIWYG